MTIDLNRANVLLDVIHKIAAAGPGFSSLTALASAELSAMNDEAAAKAAKDKEEVSKKAAAAVAAKAKVEAEAEKAKAEAEEVEKAEAEESSPTLAPAGDIGRKI